MKCLLLKVYSQQAAEAFTICCVLYNQDAKNKTKQKQNTTHNSQLHSKNRVTSNQNAFVCFSFSAAFICYILVMTRTTTTIKKSQQEGVLFCFPFCLFVFLFTLTSDHILSQVNTIFFSEVNGVKTDNRICSMDSGLSIV